MKKGRQAKYIIRDSQYNLISTNYRKWCDKNHISRHFLLREGKILIDGIYYFLEEK